MSRFPRSLRGLIFLVGVAASLGCQTALAQIPDKFTNLQILPKDITKKDLVSVMRGFAGGLGVRCNHCHVGEDAATLKGFDFASDDKPAKKTARVMMGMVKDVNATVSARSGVKDPVQVKCATCHHGVTRPEGMQDLLEAVITKDGVQAGIAKYRELKEKFYGSGAYDFTPGPLAMVAEGLSGRSDHDGAIAIVQFALELNPNAAYGYNLLGRLQQTKGDKAAAIASYKRAIELDPNDNWSKSLLQKAQGEKE